MQALAAPGVASLRNITPVFAHPEDGSAFCTLVTKATTAPSPLHISLAKLNWSDVPPMSTPPPAMTQPPLTSVAEPASVGEPMSASVQPDGKPARAALTATKRK